MSKEKIYIISNESIYADSKNYFCDNLDMKSIPEGLSDFFDINIIARKSKFRRYHSINNTNIKVSNNFFIFLILIFQTLKNKNKSKYLIISLSPFTFLASLLLYFSKIRPLVYLRSDGYEEYKSIFGSVGKFIYHIMFSTIVKTSNLISCREHILKNNMGKIVSPSQLKDDWFKGLNQPNKDKVKLLYVGRLRVEKGIFSFLDISKDLQNNIQITIITNKKDHDKIKDRKNIYLLDTQTEKDLIKEYDKSNIFILPSFTEGHPQVLDEALSRLRPVIAFREIEHVKRDRTGVFVCNRNIEDLSKTIDYIMKNYEQIQLEMRKNKLPNKRTFLKQLKDLINLSSNQERWPSG